MNNTKIVTAINEKLELQYSYSKLRWYIRFKTEYYDKYKNHIELPNDLIIRLKKAVDQLKSELHPEEYIIHKSDNKLVHPLRAMGGVYFLI